MQFGLLLCFSNFLLSVLLPIRAQNNGIFVIPRKSAGKISDKTYSVGENIGYYFMFEIGVVEKAGITYF